MYRKFLVLLFLLAAFSLKTFPQAWSTFLDPSRAVNWSSAGFTIPDYTAACPIQPTLTSNTSSAASANATSIQNALASCTSTQNVVNIPAGTYYVTAISYGTQGKQVLRGAGPNSTSIIFTTGVGCAGGLSDGICMKDSTGYYNGSSAVQPGGSNACSWTAGYAQGSTTLTLASCGSAPPLNQTIILDQANDTTDNSGLYICDTNTDGCGYEGDTGGNNNGRSISGVTHSQQQIAYVTGVTSTGGGGYTITISPGVYFSNVRSSQSPGAWWPGFVQNDGVENMTLNGTSVAEGGNVGMYDCYQCWVKNVNSQYAGRNHVEPYQSMSDVIRDSYFYQAQGTYSDSYAIEFEAASAILVENNIFQQVTTPIMFGAGTGSVIDYNYNTDVNYTCGGGCPTYSDGAYASHNAGDEMNLFEGNNFFGIWNDDAWGSTDQDTFFRNMLQAWQGGKTASTMAVALRANARNINVIGNVMGQAGYHTGYQSYATSKTAISGGPEALSIYSLGLSGVDSCDGSTYLSVCDPLSFSTLMRWGNYDTVNAATQWNTTEASPAAVAYINANFTSSYFASLAHTLPNSLYYSAIPSWWPAGKAWPPVGPDVSSGNLGTCSGGTYAGYQATSSGQCADGSLSSAWAAHATSIPAQDCYLNVLLGPPNGTGSALNFDASQCYASSGQTSGKAPSPPTGLVGTVN